jgi:hypothetical protein
MKNRKIYIFKNLQKSIVEAKREPNTLNGN